jgi:L-ascorbate metabolism protein UlaG (beta-lactamase superfamily)
MWRELLASTLRRVSAPDPRWFRLPDIACEHDVELGYLGTAGFVLRGHGHTLLLDPYVSRLGLRQLFRRRLVPDVAAIAGMFREADDVLVGHAHFDHVLDAPLICQRTGARLIGSRAVCHVGSAAGLPARQLVQTSGREDIDCGPALVRGLPAPHGKVLFGRVLFPGDITEPPPWPPNIDDLRHGQVLNWHVRFAGLTLMHVDSADYHLEELDGLRADVLCLCAAGRKFRPNYVTEIVRALRPRWVIPCHWDTMITPIDAEARLLPGIDLPGMLDEIRRAGSEPLLLPLLGRIRF